MFEASFWYVQVINIRAKLVSSRWELRAAKALLRRTQEGLLQLCSCLDPVCYEAGMLCCEPHPALSMLRFSLRRGSD